MEKWPIKKLGEVINTIESGKRPKGGAASAGIPSLGVEHITQEGGFDFSELKFIPESFYEGLTNGKINYGDILIAKDGATTGKTAFVGESFPFAKAAVNEHLFIIRGKKSLVLQKFLFFFLLSPIGQNQILKNKHGAAQGGIDKSFINFIKIPVPTLTIQQKIVERLDAIRKAQELNDKQIELAEELFQSLLHRELDPKGKKWEVKRLGELFYRQNETIVPAKDCPSENINYIGLENIESNSGMLINFTKTLGENIKSSKFIFRKEDILYGKLRPYLNKVWLAEFDGICSTDIWVLRSKQYYVLPFILANILRSKEILLQTSSFMVGSNLPRVSKEYFDSIRVHIPPLETQQKIVEKLSAVQEYKKKLLERKQKLQELFESVLDKSFKGELEE